MRWCLLAFSTLSTMREKRGVGVERGFCRESEPEKCKGTKISGWRSSKEGDAQLRTLGFNLGGNANQLAMASLNSGVRVQDKYHTTRDEQCLAWAWAAGMVKVANYLRPICKKGTTRSSLMSNCEKEWLNVYILTIALWVLRGALPLGISTYSVFPAVG